MRKRLVTVSALHMCSPLQNHRQVVTTLRSANCLRPCTLLHCTLKSHEGHGSCSYPFPLHSIIALLHPAQVPSTSEYPYSAVGMLKVTSDLGTGKSVC